jgi:hypothetical protein
MSSYGKTPEQKERNLTLRSKLTNAITTISKLTNGQIRTLSKDKTIKLLLNADQPLRNETDLAKLKKQLRNIRTRKTNFLSTISEENEKNSKPIANRVGTRKSRQFWKDKPSPFTDKDRFISAWDSGDLKEKFSFGRKALDKWGQTAFTANPPNKIEAIFGAQELITNDTLLKKCTGNLVRSSKGYWTGSHNPYKNPGKGRCCSLFKKGYVAHKIQNPNHSEKCGWAWTSGPEDIDQSGTDLFGGGRRRTRKLRR